MESTDGRTGPRIRPLTAQDLPGALALSASAHWNQCEADWRMLLVLGQGWGVDAAALDGREQLAASIVILPYGNDFAWVSMVLVLPEFQRRGFAQQLLRHALGMLASRGMAGLLDATPAGHAVYLQEGFRDTWGFARYRRERRDADGPVPARRSRPATRSVCNDDWPAIEAIDAPAFGASRMPLLHALAQRLPAAARVVEEGGRVRGFAFGRPGREATQIGPLVAADADTATALIADVLREVHADVYVDLLDSRRDMLPWLEAQGFALQRPFTRMVHGAASAPGDPTSIVLVAGPELG